MVGPLIVRLSHHQARAVARRVSTLHRDAMVEHRTTWGRTQHNYELPAIAWRQILDELLATCFGPSGGKLDRGAPKSAYGAVTRIADAVMRIEHHPGLRGRAIEGFVGDIIPAWQVTDDEWSPYPPTGRFELLKPRHSTVNRIDLTMWYPDWIPQDRQRSWTLQEASHSMFVGRSASPDAELGSNESIFELLVERQPLGHTDRSSIPDRRFSAAEQEDDGVGPGVDLVVETGQ